MADDTLDALESLVAHPGWQYLVRVGREEWVQRERQGRKNALSDTDDKRALDKLRQITAAQEAVEWVWGLPGEEISKRKRRASGPVPTETRRAVGWLTGMSRRGGM